MFESVLSKSQRPQSNVAGLIISVVIYAVLALAGSALLSHQRRAFAHDVAVTFFAAPPALPAPVAAPPPPPSGGESRAVEHKRVQKTADTVVQPKTAATDEPSGAESAQPSPSGVPGGVTDGVAGGVVGGTPGGVLGGAVGGGGGAAIPFGPGMTRPQALSGGDLDYTPAALAARVEGKVLVRCVITVAGQATDCKIIKGVPILDDVVLVWLRRSRYAPATFQGSPVAVQYLLTFNFKLP